MRKLFFSNDVRPAVFPLRRVATVTLKVHCEVLFCFFMCEHIYELLKHFLKKSFLQKQVNEAFKFEYFLIFSSI